jgi:hypothetical protein
MAQGFTKALTIDTDGTMAANSNQLVPSQAAVVTYIKEGCSYIIDSQFNLSSTNTTSQEIVYAYEIPANTLEVGDMIEINLYATKTSGSGGVTTRVYLNSANVVGGAGATQYGGQAPGAAVSNTLFAPRIFINGASAQVGYPTTAGVLWSQSVGSTMGTGTLSIASSIWVQVTNQKVTGTDGWIIQACATIIHKKR